MLQEIVFYVSHTCYRYSYLMSPTHATGNRMLRSPYMLQVIVFYAPHTCYRQSYLCPSFDHRTIWVTTTNYEVFQCVIFSSLLILPLLCIQIFFSMSFHIHKLHSSPKTTWPISRLYQFRNQFTLSYVPELGRIQLHFASAVPNKVRVSFM